jgi:hypothetical protein
MSSPGDTPNAPLVIGEADRQVLAKARWWAMFNAITGVIVVGLGALACIGVLVFMDALGTSQRILLALATAVGVVLLGAYQALLFRYSSGIARFNRGDSSALQRAFWNLKVVWIVVVVSAALGALGSVVSTVTPWLVTAGAGP